MDNFIDELLRFRAQHKLSMERVAELSGVSKTTIFNIESGVSRPSRTTIMRLRMAMERYEKESG